MTHPYPTNVEIDIDNIDPKSQDTWKEHLLVDDDLLPAGRVWSRYIVNSVGKPRQCRVYARPDSQDPTKTACYEGWLDQGQICLSTTKQDCIDFLVDWALLAVND